LDGTRKLVWTAYDGSVAWVRDTANDKEINHLYQLFTKSIKSVSKYSAKSVSWSAEALENQTDVNVKRKILAWLCDSSIMWEENRDYMSATSLSNLVDWRIDTSLWDDDSIATSVVRNDKENNDTYGLKQMLTERIDKIINKYKWKQLFVDVLNKIKKDVSIYNNFNKKEWYYHLSKDLYEGNSKTIDTIEQNIKELTKSHIYIYGFNIYSAQQMKLIKELTKYCLSVNIAYRTKY